VVLRNSINTTKVDKNSEGLKLKRFTLTLAITIRPVSQKLSLINKNVILSILNSIIVEVADVLLIQLNITSREPQNIRLAVSSHLFFCLTMSISTLKIISFNIVLY
jgi:hypothetical protein